LYLKALVPVTSQTSRLLLFSLLLFAAIIVCFHVHVVVALVSECSVTHGAHVFGLCCGGGVYGGGGSGGGNGESGGGGVVCLAVACHVVAAHALAARLTLLVRALGVGRDEVRLEVLHVRVRLPTHTARVLLVLQHQTTALCYSSPSPMHSYIAPLMAVSLPIQRDSQKLKKSTFKCIRFWYKQHGSVID
jgi:hypothetical protein